MQNVGRKLGGWGGASAHLVGHEVGQEHDVAAVDAHPVVHHGVLDLVDDGGASSLDAQRLLHLGERGNSREEIQFGVKTSFVSLVLTVESVSGCRRRLNNQCQDEIYRPFPGNFASHGDPGRSSVGAAPLKPV